MRATFLIAVVFIVSCGRAPDGTIEDTQRNREIPFAVWVPDTSQPSPLIVLSHGSGGHYSNFSWLTKILVDNGYVVAAVNHPFNTVRNNTPEGIARAWDRPPDLSLLITEVLSSDVWADAIDSSRIGAVGFSSGGYTVLSLAGAIYDIERMHAYCSSSDRGRECELSSALPLTDLAASKSAKDPRVDAVFSMAPGWGAATTPESLAAIDIPIKIVATEDDEWLKPERHAIYFDRYIPNSELVMLPKGGHFLFLSCDFITRVADWFIDQFNLCGRGIEVDRAVQQEEVAAWVVQFFNRHLNNAG